MGFHCKLLAVPDCPGNEEKSAHFGVVGGVVAAVREVGPFGQHRAVTPLLLHNLGKRGLLFALDSPASKGKGKLALCKATLPPKLASFP